MTDNIDLFMCAYSLGILTGGLFGLTIGYSFGIQQKLEKIISTSSGDPPPLPKGGSGASRPPIKIEIKHL